MNEEIEKDIKKILKEVNNVNELIERGDLILPLSLIRDMTLRFDEKVYLFYYYIFDKNIYNADTYSKLKREQLKLIKKRLCELGYITKKVNNVELLKEKTILLSHSGYKCEWCGNECYILHKHHYPKSLQEGGKNIVNICPNCHYTFHSLEGDGYE